ncbi:MAG: hypothetical protein J5666_04485 [Bacilli bacterium]|nr:hypothetical protein [Bacilli bacterium]
MFYTLEDLIKIYGSRKKATTAITSGKYEKVSRGIYTDVSKYLVEMEYIFFRYPDATLTLQSAVAFYDLSDYVPDKYYVVTPLNAHKITIDKVKQHYMQNDLCNIGRVMVKTKYGYIYIYDKERLLIEVLRLKSKLSYDYYKEIIKSYRALFNEGAISFHKIVEYCKKITYGKDIRDRIQEIFL